MLNLFKYFHAQMTDATLYRPIAGGYDAAGNWTSPGFVSSPVKILIPQPVSGEFLKLIPEGESVGNHVQSAISSDVGVRLTNTLSGPDEIEVSGERFVLVEVGRWGSYGGFDKMLLKRKG